jgi:cyclase
MEEYGAGEILLTSMDRDGTRDGYDIPLTRTIADRVGIPVIASGGAGSPADFVRVFQDTGAEAALAAGIFHFGEISIAEVKNALAVAGMPVRAVREAA